jgi:hypothetical protein
MEQHVFFYIFIDAIGIDIVTEIKYYINYSLIESITEKLKQEKIFYTILFF